MAERTMAERTMAERTEEAAERAPTWTLKYIQGMDMALTCTVVLRGDDKLSAAGDVALEADIVATAIEDGAQPELFDGAYAVTFVVARGGGEHQRFELVTVVSRRDADPSAAYCLQRMKGEAERVLRGARKLWLSGVLLPTPEPGEDSSDA